MKYFQQSSLDFFIHIDILIYKEDLTNVIFSKNKDLFYIFVNFFLSRRVLKSGLTKGLEWRRILIVDDNQRNITVLGTILHQEHYQLNIAMDGVEALEMVKVNPDLILLDVMMPNLDGYGTARSWKRTPNKRDSRHIPNSKNTSGRPRQRLDLGAVDYVTKPFETREPLSRVRTHLDKKTQRPSKAF